MMLSKNHIMDRGSITKPQTKNTSTPESHWIVPRTCGCLRTCTGRQKEEGGGEGETETYPAGGASQGLQVGVGPEPNTGMCLSLVLERKSREGAAAAGAVEHLQVALQGVEMGEPMQGSCLEVRSLTMWTQAGRTWET